VLDDWKSRPHFPVSLLHSEVLVQLKRKRPEKGRREGKLLEWCSTPVHSISSSDPNPQSIELGRIQVVDGNMVSESPPYSPRLTTYFDPRILQSTPQDNQTNALTSTFPNGDLTVPHVLISVALEEHQADLDLERCRLWLNRFPALVKYAKVQGVFKSYSTLILLSLPVVIWNMLPDNPACCFIGFVTSDNLAHTMHMPGETAIPQAASMESPVKPFQPTVAPDPLVDIYTSRDIQPPHQPDPLVRCSTSIYGRVNRNPVPQSILLSRPPSFFPAASLTASQPIKLTEGYHFASSSSRSDYGLELSVGNSSGLARNFTGLDQENHGIAGSSTDHQSFEEGEPSMSLSPNIPKSGYSICPTCKKSVKHLRQHEQRHSRSYKCDVPHCTRTQGFGSLGDLDRHKRSKHPGIIPGKHTKYYCQMAGCGVVLRREGFRNHLNRAHQSDLETEEAFEDMMQQ
jgi:hypothetical protein